MVNDNEKREVTRPSKKEYDAFISHASEDKPIVKLIVYYLENAHTTKVLLRAGLDIETSTICNAVL